jgi:hypothetical protein
MYHKRCLWDLFYSYSRVSANEPQGCCCHTLIVITVLALWSWLVALRLCCCNCSCHTMLIAVGDTCDLELRHCRDPRSPQVRWDFSRTRRVEKVARRCILLKFSVAFVCWESWDVAQQPSQDVQPEVESMVTWLTHWWRGHMTVCDSDSNSSDSHCITACKAEF